VNEAGQFIFVEQWCDEFTLFDALCDFIESGDPGFKYATKTNALRLSDLIEATKPDLVSAEDASRREVPADAEAEAA
jgi:hypothetical protein